MAGKRCSTRELDNLSENLQCVLVHTVSAADQCHYLKRVRPNEWKAQHKNKMSASKSCLANPDDTLMGLFSCQDFDNILAFSEDGRALMLRVLDVPLVKIDAPGSRVCELLPALGDGHTIEALVQLQHRELKDHTDEFLVLATRTGLVKKVLINTLSSLRPGKSLQCIKLIDGDSLRWAYAATDSFAIILATVSGKVLRCSLRQWRFSTVKAPGLLAVRLRGDDQLASVAVHKEQFPASMTSHTGAANPTRSMPSAGHGEEAGAASEEDNLREECDSENAEEEQHVCDDEALATDGVDDIGDDASCGPFLLLVTLGGMGFRTPLSSPRLQLNKRGGVPKGVIRTLRGDLVAHATVVSGRSKPKPPMSASDIWYNQCKHNKLSENDLSALDPEGDSSPCHSQSNVTIQGLCCVKPSPSVIFARLPRSEVNIYFEFAEQDKLRHDQEMKLYSQDLEEVLIGFKNGYINRVEVPSLPLVLKSLCKGKLISRCRGGEQVDVSCASVLQSINGRRASAMANGIAQQQAPSSAEPMPKRARKSNGHATGAAAAGG